MVISVKEKELNKEKLEKEKRENERTREGETKRKPKHWKSRFLDHDSSVEVGYGFYAIS